MRVCKTLNCMLTSAGGGQDAWVFAYGSLIWRPDVPVAETRTARVSGYHRGLYLWSKQYRGTPDFPGLVLALDRGGACTGLALRIAAADVPAAFAALWEREMSTGSYEPTWLSAHTKEGVVRALAFVIRRDGPNYSGKLQEQQVLHALHTGRGKFGTAREYLENTVASLHEHGFDDARLMRYVKLLRATT
jgi:glutathione-specific gamma-glutamylcyclotransferase